MDADGGNQRNLSNNDFDDWDPSWSPDGKQHCLYFVGVTTLDGVWEIYVMDADGGNPQNLTNE